jgi:hypothetical protein
VDGGVWLKPGAAIAYRGDVSFERLATQMRFEGTGCVIVQPYEDPSRFAVKINRMLRRVPIGRPRPHIANHIVETISVRRERAHRRGAFVTVQTELLPRKLALPGVGHMTVGRQKFLAPGVRRGL